VLPVQSFESAADPPGKGRRLFKQPHAGECDKSKHAYECAKWHIALQLFLSVRPPLLFKSDRSGPFRKVAAMGVGIFELA
jgi:hypothetical protein